MFCENCGAKLSGSEHFCENCGAVVSASTPAPTPVPESKPEKPQKNKFAKTAVGIVAAVALLGGGIFVGAKLLPDDEPDYAASPDIGEPDTEDAANEGAAASPAPDMMLVTLCDSEKHYNADGSVGYVVNYTYDDYGRLLTSVKAREDGSVIEGYEYRYDECGNTVYNKTYGDDLPDVYTEYTFDESNRLIKEQPFYNDGTTDGFYEYIYDENGLLLYKKTVLTDGTEYEYEEYRYDDNGLLTATTVYTQGVCDSSYEYVYDDNGNCTLSAYYDRNGDLSYIQTWEYNELGLVTRDYVESYTSGWYSVHEYTYDENGNKLSHIEYTDQTSTLTTKWTYDENGNVLTEKLYDGDSVVGGWNEWIYDEHGNITEKYWNSDGHGLDSHTYYTYITVEVPEDSPFGNPIG